MLFSSADFFRFFSIVVLTFFLVPIKYRWIWALISSYYFYSCWNSAYIVLLVFVTIVTYTGGVLLHYLIRAGKTGKKLVLGMTILIVSFVLFRFKYINFFIYTINRVFEAFSLPIHLEQLNILVPVGVSFYVLQALGYMIDVYREKIAAEKNPFRYALFVSFFPQISAGPIGRSYDLLPQIRAYHYFSWEDIKDGLTLMLWGFFLKLVIADRIAIVVNEIWGDHDKYHGCYITFAIILFAFQIYGDFAGYSFLAQGMARVMGFHLMENFKAPYLTKSVAEFWRSWHISLSTWFRDYIYIPLGGNRKGDLRKYLNLMLVFLVSGLWHGAAWNYVVWGGLNGIYQVIGGIRKKFILKHNNRRNNMFWDLAKIGTTFFLIDFAWLFFRANSLEEALWLIKDMITVRNYDFFRNGGLEQLGLIRGEWFLLFGAIIVMLFVDYMRSKEVLILDYLKKKPGWLRWITLILFFWIVVMFGIYGENYEASAFIYSQF